MSKKSESAKHSQGDIPTAEKHVKKNLPLAGQENILKNPAAQPWINHNKSDSSLGNHKKSKG
jgi:hypothetical protein